VPELEEIASKEAYVQAEFNSLREEDRIRRTRGIIVDFGMISGMWAEPDSLIPEAVVCGMRWVSLFARTRSLNLSTARSSATWLLSGSAGLALSASKTGTSPMELGMMTV
jgi:hypothetical protein